jgi:uncharacterized membrane protein (UPF0127 family)
MIKNTTRDSVLNPRVVYHDTILSKASGLMFSRKIDRAHIFIFKKPRRIDLHMFFVFYPIDVLFLNREKEVIEIKKNFKPFTIYVSKRRASFVIELPESTVNNTKTRIGDKITF